MEVLRRIAEGGQTWAHRVRMLRQVMKIAILTSLSIAALIFASMMCHLPSIIYKASWYHAKALTS